MSSKSAYVSKLAKFAWRETNQLLQLEPRAGLFYSAIALVGVWVSSRLSGKWSEMTTGALLAEWIAPTVVLTAIAWLFLFLLSALVHAPFAFYRRHRRHIEKQMARVSRLKAELFRKRRNQDLSDKMSDHHEYAVHELLAKAPNTPLELEAWITKEKKWRESCLNDMRRFNCSTQEKRHVQTLGLVPMVMQHEVRAIEHQLSMLVTRMARIADIASKYGE
jgi:hypothetical protein